METRNKFSDALATRARQSRAGVPPAPAGEAAENSFRLLALKRSPGKRDACPTLPACRLGYAFALALTFSLRATALPSDWQHEQRFDVTAPGLVKFGLPAETLNAARPALEDLRLYDDAGNELPFFIERPAPVARVVQPAKSFQVSLNANTTVITLETGLAPPLDGVALETPAGSFIKAVRVEGSADGQRWQTLATGQPIFREPSGASQLHMTIPPGVWQRLRLTVDDARTQPIPFTSARVFAAAAEMTPMELQPATIAERNENPGETRLTLNLGAANLDVASVQIETDEPLFTRAVTFAVPVVSEDAVREQAIGQGCVYRVAVEGQKASENLSVPLENRVPSHELILIIKNGDSPPLAITGVRVERRPVNLVFMARAAGNFHLLTGNSRCPAPRYDLASLGADFKNVAVTPVKISALADNPDFRAPEALAGVELAGTALDVGLEISQAGENFRRRRTAIGTRPRCPSARAAGLRGFARDAWQQSGALHRAAHVHQPRAYAVGHSDERCEAAEVEPLDDQAAAGRAAAVALELRGALGAVPARHDAL